MSVGTLYSKQVILILLSISLLCLFLLPKLKVSISTDALMTSYGDERKWYEYSSEVFGKSETAVVVFHDEQLFARKRLTAIKQTVNELSELPFISSTVSLYNQKNYKSIDGNVSANPYCGTEPSTKKELEAIKKDILFNPILRNQLLSEDAKTMAVQLIFDKSAAKTYTDHVTQESIEKILEPVRNVISKVYQVGDNSLRDDITHKMMNDQKTLLPASLLTLFLMLLLTLRCLNGAIIPLITGAISIIWTLSIMVLLDININVLTAIVPALLIIIGSTEDVHLLSSYYAFRREGNSKDISLSLLNKEMGVAVLLTALTTYVGFISIMTNNIEIVKQFGFVASIGLLFNFIITLLLVPAWLKLSEVKVSNKDPNIMLKRQYKTLTFMVSLCALTQKYNKHTLLFVIIITLLSLASLNLVQINSNALDYFDKEDPIYVNMKHVEEKLVGIESFSVIVRSPIEDTFLKVKYLNELKNIQNLIDDSGYFDKSTSFVNYMEFVDAVMNEDRSGEFQLPERDDVIEEYNLFLDQQDVRSYINPKYNEVQILVWHKLHNSHDLYQAVKDIKNKVYELKKNGNLSDGLEIHFTGKSILNSVATESIALGQIASLALMLFVIWSLISLLFANFKAGLIAMVPNILPIMLLFAVMGIFDIPLNASTVMVAAIAIGLGVDNTIHFMVRYHNSCKKIRDKGQSLEVTVKEELTPIMATSFSLFMGFLVLSSSAFSPISLFGALSAMVIVFSFITTFSLLPILLCTTRLITIWDILDIKVKEAVLYNCQIFKGLSAHQIKRLILETHIHSYHRSEVIISQKDVFREMYIILDGSVDVYDAHNPDVFLYQLKEGDVFGEVSLLLDTERTRMVKASTDVQAIKIDWETLRYIGRHRPKISNRLFFNLSELLRQRIGHTDSLILPNEMINPK
ncbi:MAG: MMPL family transporter [Gammaproteobacteria bacterium]|nr:MMPL family transporter [Gammaproteobacteria bacterium]